MDEDSAPPDDSVDWSPTSTLCAEEDSMEVDEAEAMWADIDDSTPAVEMWVPSAFFHRLKKLLSYMDALTARFNLSDVPAGCTWGTGPTACSLTLNNRVVQIWAIGHLKAIWVFATEEDARPSVRFALDLLREVDTAGVKRLMGLSTVMPRKSWLSSNDFCADKLGHRDRRVFRDVYDARRIYADKSLMPKLQPTELTIGDVVLVECSLVRCQVDRACPEGWTLWTAAFQLHAISVLLSRADVVGDSRVQDHPMLGGFNDQL